MDSGNALMLAVPVVILFVTVMVVATAARQGKLSVGVLSRESRRRERDSKTHSTVGANDEVGELADTAVVTKAVRVPLSEDQIGVTRRQFFNRGIMASMALTIGGFGAQALAFLYPAGGGGFGSKVKAGALADILAFIDAKKEPYYVPEARTYIVRYPTGAAVISKAKAVYTPSVVSGMEEGVVALYQKCVHLGCRVPWCATSQWFECPCHGSKYNRVGEKRGGPAPRGLDRFPMEFSGGQVTINTGLVQLGPAIGVDTTGQGAEGPSCV